MTRRLVLGSLLACALFLGIYCGSGRDERDPSERARALEAAADDPYDPTAMDVPLTVDFEKAASKRVQPDNYRKELTRIERELKALKAR